MAAPPSLGTMRSVRRRDLLKILGAAPVAASLACAGRDRAGFLTDRERALVARLADQVLPPDDTPGAVDLGAVDYIDALLAGTGLFFAQGPYSGRTRYPDVSGAPTDLYPEASFEQRAPLDRVQHEAWRRLLLGHADDPGLRALFRGHLEKADEDATLDDLAPDFRDALVDLVAEGCFADPVYGGNREGQGWQLAHFPGDQMPYGFALYDETTRTYRERPDMPVSRADPGPDPEPISDDVHALLEDAIGVLGGRIRRG
jgi:gluconate 2-dehydrogenase gamma chain